MPVWFAIDAVDVVGLAPAHRDDGWEVIHAVGRRRQSHRGVDERDVSSDR